MSDNNAWRIELAAIRERWTCRPAGDKTTVWDALVQSHDAAGRQLWAERLERMGIAVVSTAELEVLDSPVQGCVRLRLRSPGAPDAFIVAVEDPWNEELLLLLARKLGRAPRLATASGVDFARWQEKMGVKAVEGASIQGAASPPADTDAQIDAVIRFVGDALQQAIALGSSDIHFETDRRSLVVKHRVDGVLRLGARIEPLQRAEEVISRIKVLAKLDITERRVPQDGRFRHDLPGDGAMDLRVSIMPSVHGEDAVLRLLDRAQLRTADAAASLDALQFDPTSVACIRELAQLPHGMLLITGPTGSGKTTTVYGVLSELNSGEEKIVTIEDPVEYELPGVLQIPVNERKGLTFAKGLRSILRHDPDRILVGEIRDAETAEIAVQSALTGHQVFTTVHANSLFDVTGRFRHFGLDMFGFVAALNGVVVQRLVRALCPLCAGERPATERERDWMARQGVGEQTQVPLVVGCDGCSGSGYRKRFVLAEVHQVDDLLRDLITGQQAISAMRSHVAASGVASLAQVAALAVQQRRTSFEEVRRVVGLA
jgi:general secretion pathway protein E